VNIYSVMFGVRTKNSQFMSKHVAQSHRLTLSYHQKTAIVFRMIYISFIHITDTKRNITLNKWQAVKTNTELNE
jgi:hypothetical protein